jgi:hypothetical protein
MDMHSTTHSTTQDTALPVLPLGMCAIDDACIVRVASITAIAQHNDAHTAQPCTTVYLGTATFTIECDIEELLRRIAAQNPVNSVGGVTT